MLSLSEFDYVPILSLNLFSLKFCSFLISSPLDRHNWDRFRSMAWCFLAECWFTNCLITELNILSCFCYIIVMGFACFLWAKIQAPQWVLFYLDVVRLTEPVDRFCQLLLTRVPLLCSLMSRLLLFVLYYLLLRQLICTSHSHLIQLYI